MVDRNPESTEKKKINVGGNLGRRMDFYLEQALVGEASPEVMARIAADPLAKQKLQDLKAENEAFLTRYPPRFLATRIQEKSLAKQAEAQGSDGWISAIRGFFGHKTGRGALLGLAGGLPLALVLMFFAVQAFMGSIGNFDGSAMVVMDDTRTKGMEQGLLVYRQESAGSSELKNNSPIDAFENIQIAYRPGDGSFGFIFSLDGRGRLTLHYPESFGASPVMQAGSQTLLPFAYQLDDAPNFERFYLAVSKSDFNLQTVWADLEQQVEKILANQGPQLTNPPALTVRGQFSTVYLDLRKTGGGR